jgi:uncharacterized protein
MDKQPPVLAQLAREPVAGQVKTRLQPHLSAREAAQLHELMVEHVCTMLCNSAAGAIQLWVDGDPEAQLFRKCRELGVDDVLLQQGADLGERMAHICKQGLLEHRAVILVGSDAPSMDCEYLNSAVDSLTEVDVVVGPALDGGYVLLGLGRYSAALFEGIHWGEDTVLTETLAVIDRLGWSYRLLEPLQDIDRPQDLRFLPDTIKAALPGEPA